MREEKEEVEASLLKKKLAYKSMKDLRMGAE